MIAPADKDKVLIAIASHDDPLFYIHYDDVFPKKDVSENKFRLILNQFVQMGLLNKASSVTGGAFSVVPTANLYDFLSHGGFVAKEEILRANLEKLDYELTKLAKDIDPTLSSRVENITGIAASIATALNLFSQ